MKKHSYISIFLLLACCGFYAALTSCRPYIDDVVVKPPITVNCLLNIQGGCLDQWELIDDGFHNICMEPAGGYLRTLNYLTTLPESAGGPGPLTSDSSSDSYSGLYAAVLTTATFSPMGSPIIIPGIIGTDSLDIPNATIVLGKRYTARPTKFQGYYKYQPVGGDSALILVLLSKYNSGAGHRDTVAYAEQYIKTPVPAYTFLDLPIDYATYANANNPDTLTLIICSSGGVNFVDLMNCKGQVGSKMWIDEIQFVMP
jgi:hypothetical protein